MTDLKTRPGRYTDTRAAIAANILRKRRRWARELRAAGWTVEEPAPEPKP